MRKNEIEIHGVPVVGHKHEFHYVSHSSFSSHSKCKCGAVEYNYYSPDGYIGDHPRIRIFEKGSCYFRVAGPKYTGEFDCPDVLKGVPA